MQDKRHKHNHSRPVRGFDTHSGGATRRAGGEYRRRANWRFYDVFHRETGPFERHVRQVNRFGGMTGKHLRVVDEPARSSHGKQE